MRDLLRTCAAAALRAIANRLDPPREVVPVKTGPWEWPREFTTWTAQGPSHLRYAAASGAEPPPPRGEM